MLLSLSVAMLLEPMNGFSLFPCVCVPVCVGSACVCQYNTVSQCRTETQEQEASHFLKALTGLLIYDVIFRLGYIF